MGSDVIIGVPSKGYGLLTGESPVMVEAGNGGHRQGDSYGDSPFLDPTYFFLSRFPESPERPRMVKRKS